MTVPGTVMQVARIFADYSPSSGGSSAWVTYKTLRAETHRSNDALDGAIQWLIGHGWFVPRNHPDGTRITYDLTFGTPGKPRQQRTKPLRLSERFA